MTGYFQKASYLALPCLKEEIHKHRYPFISCGHCIYCLYFLFTCHRNGGKVMFAFLASHDCHKKRKIHIFLTHLFDLLWRSLAFIDHSIQQRIFGSSLLACLQVPSQGVIHSPACGGFDTAVSRRRTFPFEASAKLPVGTSTPKGTACCTSLSPGNGSQRRTSPLALLLGNLIFPDLPGSMKGTVRFQLIRNSKMYCPDSWQAEATSNSKLTHLALTDAPPLQ